MLEQLSRKELEAAALHQAMLRDMRQVSHGDCRRSYSSCKVASREFGSAAQTERPRTQNRL